MPKKMLTKTQAFQKTTAMISRGELDSAPKTKETSPTEEYVELVRDALDDDLANKMSKEQYLDCLAEIRSVIDTYIEATEDEIKSANRAHRDTATGRAQAMRAKAGKRVAIVRTPEQEEKISRLDRPIKIF